jgi:hypothetical protein
MPKASSPKERPDGIDIAPMADFFLCDGLPRPIPKTGFSTSLRPAVTLDDRPPRDNRNSGRVAA